MLKKKLSIFEEGFGRFMLPEWFETAEESHPTENWFNLLDGPCENVSTNFLWFVDWECLLEEEEEELSIQFDWILKQF